MQPSKFGTTPHLPNKLVRTFEDGECTGVLNGSAVSLRYGEDYGS